MEPTTTTVLAKPWWTSKTLWFNAITLVVMVLAVVIENAGLIELPSQAVGLLTMGLAIGNAVLRFISNVPLAGGADQTTELPAPAEPFRG
jgi:hypothetical protein